MYPIWTFVIGTKKKSLDILAELKYSITMMNVRKKLKELRARIFEGERKLKRIRVKGLGVIVVNEDGTHADVSRWKKTP